MDKTSKANFAYKLSLLAVVAAFVVIAMGAFTRLVEAGLGCPDWPTCYGHILWPSADADVDIANMTYAETPVEKNKMWPEQVHRLFASSLGLISLFIFFLMLRKSTDKKLNIQLIGLSSILLTALFVRIASAAKWEITAAPMFDSFDSVLVVLMVVVFFLFGCFSACSSLGST